MVPRLRQFGDIFNVSVFEAGDDQVTARTLRHLSRPDPPDSTLELQTGAAQQDETSLATALRVLPHFVGREIYVLRLRTYGNVEFSFFASRLKAGLINIWANVESGAETESWIKLAGTIPNSHIDPSTFLADHVTPILSRLVRIRIVLIIDFGSCDRLERARYDSLTNQLLSLTRSCDLRIVRLLPPKTDDLDQSLRSKRAETSQLREKVAEIQRSSKRQSENQHNVDGLRSLIMLNHPASHDALYHVARFHPRLLEELRDAVRKNLARQHNGLVELAARTVNAFGRSKEVIRTASQTERLAGLGAGALNFQTPAWLKGVNDQINIAGATDSTPIEAGIVSSVSRSIASLYGNKKLEAACYLEELEERLLTKESLVLENQQQIATIFDYTSQLILSGHLPSSPEALDIIEGVGFSLAEFIASAPDATSIQAIQASRLVYKIGYLFDFMLNRSRSSSDDPRRVRIYLSSAKHLPKENAAEASQAASLAYRRASALFHAGNTPQAFATYLQSAGTILRARGVGVGFTPISASQLRAFELGALATTRMPNEASEADKTSLHAINKEFLRTATTLWSVAEYENRVKNIVSERAIVPWAIRSATGVVRIVATGPDLSTALTITSQLFDRYGLISELIHVTDDHLLCLTEELDGVRPIIVCGAPDTPHGVGAAVLQIAPILGQLYYQRMGDDFHFVDVSKRNNTDLIVLCASGSGQLIEAWTHFLESKSKDISVFRSCDIRRGNDVMLELIQGSFLTSLLSESGKQIVQTVFNAVRQRLGTEKTTSITVQEKESMEARLNLLEQKFIETSSTPSADQLAELLSLEDLTPRAQIQFTNLFEESSVFEVLSTATESLDVVSLDAEELDNLLSQSLTYARRVMTDEHLGEEEFSIYEAFCEEFENLKERSTQLVRARQVSGKTRVGDRAALTRQSQQVVVRFFRFMTEMVTSKNLKA